MPAARIIALASALPLAIGGYIIFYCVEKARYAAGAATSVGDDVIVLGYVAAATAGLLSSLAAFMTRNETVNWRALPAVALIAGLGALSFWLWLHLSGALVPFSSVMKP